MDIKLSNKIPCVEVPSMQISGMIMQKTARILNIPERRIDDWKLGCIPANGVGPRKFGCDFMMHFVGVASQLLGGTADINRVEDFAVAIPRLENHEKFYRRRNKKGNFDAWNVVHKNKKGEPIEIVNQVPDIIKKVKEAYAEMAIQVIAGNAEDDVEIQVEVEIDAEIEAVADINADNLIDDMEIENA